MLSALCCAINSLGTIIESLDITLAAVSAIIIWIALLEFGYKTAWGIYFSTAIISVLFLPSKFCGLFFAFISGWYPMFKLFLGKKIRKRSLLWVIKLICFNLVSIALVFAVEVFGKVLGIIVDEKVTLAWIAIVLVLSNIALIVVDILMDQLIVIYIHKVRNKLIKLKIIDKKQ